MARIRTIKPEFWTDERLVTLPFEARLLFVGLWNFADDEGYFWDEPVRIKLQIMPADDVDAGKLLSLLEDSGVLRRCKTVENRCAWHIVNFKKHQRVSHPSKSEIAPLISTFANPPEHSRALPPELSGIEGNREDLDAARPEDNGLIPVAAAKGKSLSATWAIWFSDHGLAVPPRSKEPREAYRVVIEAADHELGPGHPKYSWALARAIAECVAEGTDTEVSEAAESHLRRLVRLYGGVAVFDTMEQGVIWGAGIDKKFAEDPLSLTKYATKILSKEDA